MGQLIQQAQGGLSQAGSYLGSQGGGMDPNAGVGASSAAGVAGMGLNALSSITGGFAQASSYGQQAELARLNAIDASAQGDWNATATKMRYTGEANRAITGLAGGNVGLSGANVKSTTRSIQSIGAMDADILHYKAERQAWGYLTEAAMDKAAGKQAILSGFNKAAGGFLSGEGSLAQKWGAFQQQGLSPSDQGSSGFTADAGPVGNTDVPF